MELSDDGLVELEPSQDDMDYNSEPEVPTSPVPFEQFEPPERSLGALDNRSPPGIEIMGTHMRAAELDGGMDDYLSQDEDAHLDRDYRFDHLLGDAENDDQNEHFPEHMVNPFPEDEEGGLDDAMEDEDFGLPDGQGDQEQPEAFRFEIDEDLLEELAGQADNDFVDAGEGAGDRYQAFNEHELVRNAYIDAFIQKTVFGATHRAISHQLRAACRTISANPNVPLEDITNMAQTIRTAETRLGVGTDAIITTYTLCPKCRRRYTPEHISTTDSDTCLNPECEGILFVVRRLASGGERRVSNLTFPFASPIAWIKHLVNLPGVSELLQHWRNDQSDHEVSRPIPSGEWMENLDLNKPIGNISDGWGWRSTSAGLERRIDPNTGHVYDNSVLDPPIRFVSLPFGLSLTLNTDWFQATKEQNYSVGACYLALNNLPRHLRFLRENISLCIVMPGPKEPNDYALDQMLEPLVDELLQLKQGVRMTVRRGNPPVYEEEVVHGELSQHIADLIARIKMGGGAGLKSELNFCLYCHSLLSSLSVPAGYMREEFRFRDPQEELRNAYRWRALDSIQERRQLFNETGNRFTALHRIPGWHTSTSSPIDAMHLLYLGAMNWIVKQVLVAPGIFNKRRPADQDPQIIFNNSLGTMWVPKSFNRLPPKLGQTRGSIKADQWKLTSRVLHIPLYMALRTGDEIHNTSAPSGTRSSPSEKHRGHRAYLLHQQRQKYFESIGQPDLCPPLRECYSSRNLRFHYRQVLRFCVGVNIIDRRSVTAAEIAFAQQLLELLAKDYVTHNVPLPPNFHYMMHLEESILKSGSVYNTHVWGMERTNKIVSQVNHNGKGRGVLEGTLMRGWWNYTAIQNLIEVMRSLPNPTEADQMVIRDLLMALRGGPEHAHQKGTLGDFITQCQSAYTQLYGIHEPFRLSMQSRTINIEKLGIYELMLQFCIELWPDAGIFGPGLARNLYLAPVGMVRNHSYVEFNGTRYGAYTHTSGKGYSYGYIDGRHAVRIERILHVKFEGEEGMECICALVRGFQLPRAVPQFPWDNWAGHLGTASWEFGELGEPMLIHANRFSGIFALFEVPMSYGRYWVTVALDSVTPERDPDDDYE
ncbi:Transposase family tnp2 [Ceratobasidium sp. AG-Ba]|nr:Transposase family tnp2 [Ceratobasidium sp. AG-Ba]QRW07209.1 Transposase family tnp2 [Ceratobasidium sp. AG-Ba]